MTKFVMLAVALLACSSKKDEPKPSAPAGGPAASAPAPESPKAAAAAAAPAEPKAKNACSYITEAEATAAFGFPMKYRSNDGESSNCILDSVDESKVSSVDFEIKPGLGTYDYNAKTGKPVEGVGEKATYNEPTLCAVKNGSSVSATVVKNGKMTDVMAEGKILVGKMIEKM